MFPRDRHHRDTGRRNVDFTICSRCFGHVLRVPFLFETRIFFTQIRKSLVIGECPNKVARFHRSRFGSRSVRSLHCVPRKNPLIIYDRRMELVLSDGQLVVLFQYTYEVRYFLDFFNTTLA